MKGHSMAMRFLAAALCLLAAILCASPFTTTGRAASTGDTSYQQGQAAAKAGNYAAAVQDYQSALLNGQNDANTFYQLGLAYQHVKQWNYAVWAISMALGDDAFNRATPAATTQIQLAEKAGGENAGPPPALANVTVNTSTTPTISPAEAAVQESQQAYSALQSGGYFVSPGFNQTVNIDTANVLTAAAEDIGNNSNTTTKFAYLDAVPAPYTDLAAYAHDLFTQLSLTRTVLVVVTPTAAAAYSDRLDESDAAKIVAAQWKTVGIKDPVNLAATIARDVVKQADNNDNAAQTKDIVIAVIIAVVVLALVGFAMAMVVRSGSQREVAPQRRRVARSRAH
jgi:tetratricopeptide (TPR) repeat protein